MEYTDESFREEKQPSEEEKHLGILGRNRPAAQTLSVLECCGCQEYQLAVTILSFMARSGCSTAVASMSEGDRLRVWHGRVDRITLLLGQFSELSSRC